MKRDELLVFFHFIFRFESNPVLGSKHKSPLKLSRIFLFSSSCFRILLNVKMEKFKEVKLCTWEGNYTEINKYLFCRKSHHFVLKPKMQPPVLMNSKLILSNWNQNTLQKTMNSCLSKIASSCWKSNWMRLKKSLD